MTGTMEDVGKSVLICDTCEYVDWDKRTADGDPCPKCDRINFNPTTPPTPFLECHPTGWPQ